jgi:hypothetical protein
MCRHAQPHGRRACARAALVRALAPLAELGPEYLAASEGAIYLWAKLPPGAPGGVAAAVSAGRRPRPSPTELVLCLTRIFPAAGCAGG